MSAFVVSKHHVAALVKFYGRELHRSWHAQAPAESIPQVWAADLLMSECVTSVSYRYSESPDISFDMPETFTLRDIDSAPMLSPVQAIKAAQCLAYQSCEHPQWADSLAKRLLDSIKSAAIARLPGYEDADWAIA